MNMNKSLLEEVSGGSIQTVQSACMKIMHWEEVLERKMVQ